MTSPTPQDREKLVRELLATATGVHPEHPQWQHLFCTFLDAERAILTALSLNREGPTVKDALDIAQNYLCDAVNESRGEMQENARRDLAKIEAALASLNRVSIADETQMRQALEKCRDKFREYERLHLDKVCAPDRGDVFDVREKANREARRKAKRNREMAKMCEAALSSTPPGVEDIRKVARLVAEADEPTPTDGEESR